MCLRTCKWMFLRNISVKTPFFWSVRVCKSLNIILVPWYWWAKVIIFYSFLHVLQLKYKVTNPKRVILALKPSQSNLNSHFLSLFNWRDSILEFFILNGILSSVDICCIFLFKAELNALHQKTMTENIIEIITFKMILLFFLRIT